MDFELDIFYYLSTDGYKFKYRLDKYNRNTIHVEMFNGGNIVHKQIAVSNDYGIRMNHNNIINALEAKITLKELDPTGLKQIV